MAAFKLSWTFYVKLVQSAAKYILRCPIIIVPVFIILIYQQISPKLWGSVNFSEFSMSPDWLFGNGLKIYLRQLIDQVYTLIMIALVAGFTTGALTLYAFDNLIRSTGCYFIHERRLIYVVRVSLCFATQAITLLIAAALMALTYFCAVHIYLVYQINIVIVLIITGVLSFVFYFSVNSMMGLIVSIANSMSEARKMLRSYLKLSSFVSIYVFYLVRFAIEFIVLGLLWQFVQITNVGNIWSGAIIIFAAVLPMALLRLSGAICKLRVLIGYDRAYKILQKLTTTPTKHGTSK